MLVSRMAAAPQWHLVSRDLFDRESPAQVEASSSSVQGALASLWDAVLSQGVQDDGQPTFTAFELRSPQGRRVAIPRDPLKNPELAQLRARLHEHHLPRRLAEVHAARLDEPFSFEPFLALPVVLPPPVMEVARTLAQALGTGVGLAFTAPGWRCGERVEIGTTGSQHGNSFESAQTAWTVRAEGLVVTVTDVAEAGWYREVTSDGGPGATVLRDALVAAGLG